jgi:pimeloyl-ACP methyl ester carboxylesterase
MERTVTGGHIHRAIDVPVAGGDLRVGVWEPPDADAPTVLLVHGVTASHLAWQWVADALPGIRVVAPDLRGRGRSTGVQGPAGMAAHADDLAAVADALGLGPVVVVGHSMGAFAAVVCAHRHPERVSRLVLVDGGLPLQTPEGLSPQQLVDAVLGATAARLRLRFVDLEAYLAFWSTHPAFDAIDSRLTSYFAYDLVADGDMWRPATSLDTTVEDTVDLHSGLALPTALAETRHPTELITVSRGLQNEPPGLYSTAYLDEVLPRHPGIVHQRWDGFNHYTVVMSDAGATRVAERIVQAVRAA